MFQRTIALLTIVISVGAVGASAKAQRRNPEGPLVQILVPADGARVNASRLRLQALVAARQSDARRSFVFAGDVVAGRNAGQIEAIDVSVDGVLFRRLPVDPCRRQFVVDDWLPLASLPDGVHTLRITVAQGSGRNPRTHTQQLTFTIDRTLAPEVTNRLEAAATPSPFGCFAVRDADDNEDDDGPPLRHPEIRGRFVLSGVSDGIDLAHDRIVIAAAGLQRVFEPGSLTCTRSMVCRADDRFHPFVQRLVLERRDGRLWRFRVFGGPQWPEHAVVHLRIGNDWGAIDLDTGERIGRVQEALDTAHRDTATIDSAGGQLQATDANGVVFRLAVPPGALTRPTMLGVTPLSTSPVAGTPMISLPGIKLEPEGLQFATPVTLTIDTTSTAVTLPFNTQLFLVTSPLTTVPLRGSLNAGHTVLTATLRHFSPYVPGSTNPALVDRVAWANSVLGSTAPMSQAEIESLLAVVGDQQLVGCTTDCIDLATVSARIAGSIATAAAADCGNPTANASIDAVTRLLALERLAQEVGASVPSVLSCAEQMIATLIGRIAAPASAAETDPTLTEAKKLADVSTAFGLNALRDAALAKLAEGLRLVAQSLLNAVARAPDAAAETRAKDEAKRGLESAKVWVKTLSPDVQRIDVNLLNYLANALDSLMAGWSVKMLGGTYTYYGGETPFYSFTTAVGAIGAGAGVAVCNYAHTDSLLVDTLIDATTSVSLTATDANASVTSVVHRVQGGVALEIDGRTTPGAPCQTYGSVATMGIWATTTTLEITAPTPGIFRLRSGLTPGDEGLGGYAIFASTRPYWAGGNGFAGGDTYVYGTPRDVVAIIKEPATVFLTVVLGNRDLTGGQRYSAIPTRGTASTLTFKTGDGQIPLGVPSTAITSEDMEVPVVLHATSPTNDDVSYQIDAFPTHGTLSGAPPNMTYTPALNFHGADSFTYIASDGDATAPITVDLTVTDVNDAPTAVSNFASTQSGTSVPITLKGSDPDGDQVFFTIVTPPAHGTLSGAAPNVVYTPTPGYSGTDTFSFVTSDGSASSAPATITIQVQQAGGES